MKETKAVLKQTIRGLEAIIKGSFWMSRRYAHGRHTYAPGIIREQYKYLKKWRPELVPEHDDSIQPPKDGDVHGMSFRDDYLDDCND